jgi:hypothetical protein
MASSMWGSKREELQRKQVELVARSHALRQLFAEDVQPLRRPFAIADRIHHGVGWLAAHPKWIAALVAAPLILRPRRALGWALKGWSTWRLWRRARHLFAFL